VQSNAVVTAGAALSHLDLALTNAKITLAKQTCDRVHRLYRSIRPQAQLDQAVKKKDSEGVGTPSLSGY